jgi:hypothetical protein
MLFSIFFGLQSEIVDLIILLPPPPEAIPLFEKEGLGEIFRISRSRSNFKKSPSFPLFQRGK